LPEIKNPQQDGNDFQRMLLVFALTFIAIAASQFLLSKYGPKAPPNPADKAAEQQQVAQNQNSDTPASTTQTKGAPHTGAAPARSSQVGTTKGSTTASAPTPAITKQASAESTTVIENDLYKITFTNKGAQVTSWILKKHKDDSGNLLDLVNPRGAAAFGYPLSLFTYDPALRAKLNSALYVPNSTSGELKAPADITFEYAGDGLVVRKSFHFDHSYVVKVETSVQQDGKEVTAFPAWPGGFGDQTNLPAWASEHLDFLAGSKVERQAAKEGGFFSFLTGGRKAMPNGNTIFGPFHWAGAVDQYFGAVFLPDDPANAAMVEFHDVIPQDPNEKDPAKRKSEVFDVLGLAVGNLKGPTTERLFVGPKAVDVLGGVRSYSDGSPAVSVNGKASEPDGPSLENIIDFGTFAIIAKPLFIWLNWTHDHWIPNWGWAIVFLTIVINLAMFPMRYTGMKSALLQQKIAPELKAINRKYEGLKLTDPRQHDKQQEVAALMKREGINQFAGCLPQLIQLPFLWAFYTMLATVNELRHAHWLWIKDLSSPDPWKLLPILIVVTMFLMQRATPMAGVDPSQAKMMQVMMPIMFGGISWSLASGLGVYWITGTLVGWGLQIIMNNTPMAKEIRAHLAKRAAKKNK
jgi:YidC/Oxa1 family membrane protein insertase